MQLTDLTKKAMRIALVPAMALAVGGCMFVPPAEEKTSLDKDSMTLVWEDSFNQASSDPDSSNWKYETGAGGWGNNEVQTYTSSRTNSYVSDGTLKIKAVKDGSGNWTSARLKTAGLRHWKYGYIEASIKVPASNGTWPAFWMMPESSVYGSWPRSGEIDIMEHSPKTAGLNHVYGTVHYGDSLANHQYTSIGSSVIDTATTAFHRYGISWKADGITLYFDGQKVGNAYPFFSDWARWPYDQDFYIILNMAMGGNLGGAIDSSISDATYEIDYVRVYQ